MILEDRSEAESIAFELRRRGQAIDLMAYSNGIVAPPLEADRNLG